MWIYYVKILAFEVIDVIKIILCFIHLSMGFPSGSVVKNSPAGQEVQEMGVRSLSWEGMAAHSSILAWRIPWTVEPGGIQSAGLQRVKHDWSDFTHTHTHTSKYCLPQKIGASFKGEIFPYPEIYALFAKKHFFS